MALLRELGNRRGIVEALQGLANVAIASAHPDRAARIWGAAEHLREDIGCPLPPKDRPAYTATLQPPALPSPMTRPWSGLGRRVEQ